MHFKAQVEGGKASSPAGFHTLPVSSLPTPGYDFLTLLIQPITSMLSARAAQQPGCKKHKQSKTEKENKKHPMKRKQQQKKWGCPLPVRDIIFTGNGHVKG